MDGERDGISELLAELTTLAIVQAKWVLLACLLLAAAGAAYVVGRRRAKGRSMAKHRRRFIERLVCDAIVDGVDNAFLEGRISGPERKYWFELLSKKLRMPDLEKKSKAPSKKLKNQIRDRLGPDADKKLADLRASKPKEVPTKKKFSVVRQAA